MQTLNYNIPAGDKVLACQVDFADDCSSPTIICLHGGGPAGKDATGYLAAVLQQTGKSVIRFDFSGHGESSGKMTESSLAKRLLESKAVLDYFNLHDGISVIGTSMGGYIPCKLINEIYIENLILFGPAAYSTRAWDVPFGAGFTEIIREENSFLQSDIPELLAHFRGKALLIMGEQDEIIPPQVVALYKQALSQCSGFESLVILDCPHPIHRWVLSHPEVREEIEQKVVQFLG